MWTKRGLKPNSWFKVPLCWEMIIWHIQLLLSCQFTCQQRAKQGNFWLFQTDLCWPEAPAANAALMMSKHISYCSCQIVQAPRQKNIRDGKSFDKTAPSDTRWLMEIVSFTVLWMWAIQEGFFQRKCKSTELFIFRVEGSKKCLLAGKCRMSPNGAASKTEEFLDKYEYCMHKSKL